MVCVAEGVIRAVYKKKSNEYKVRKSVEIIIFLTLFFGGLLLRIYQFPEIPRGISQDGVMTAVDAKALLQYRTDRFGNFMPAHLQGWTYGQQSAFLAYFTIPFVKMFGLNTLAMRLPQLILSMMGIVAIFFICKAIGGTIMGLCGMAFTVINPWHFMQSRWAIDCNSFPHVFVLGFLVIILGVRYHRRSMIFSSMVFFGLSMYCYGVSFFFVPFFLVTVCIYLLATKEIRWLDALICVAVYLLVCWPECLVMVINYFKLPTIKLPFVTIQYFDESVRSRDLLMTTDNLWEQLSVNFRCLIDTVLFQRNQDTWDSFIEFGTIYKCSIPLVFMGFIISIKRVVCRDVHKHEYMVVILYYMMCMLLGVLVNGINVPRLNVLQYANIILIAISLEYITQRGKNAKWVLVGLYAFIAVLFVNSYYTNVENRISAYMFEDFEAALECAKNLEGDRYYITPNSSSENSGNVSEIISLFVFDVDSLFFRGLTKEDGLLYSEKYKYENLDNDTTLDEGTVYVYKIELNSYDTSEYEVYQYGGYGVAKRR